MMGLPWVDSRGYVEDVMYVSAPIYAAEVL